MSPVDSDDDFVVTYTAKDVILYALSIGFGASDLHYVYEQHPHFTVVPSFCLTFVFWAQQRRNNNTTTAPANELPAFPPPLMRHMGVIPPRCLKTPSLDLNQFPILHVRQSVIWYGDLQVPHQPCHAVLRGRVVAVSPKSVGTFVTTETLVHQNNNHLCCVMQTTVLILGMPPDTVVPFEMETHSNNSTLLLHPPIPTPPPTTTPDVEHKIKVESNTALLYRVASGDTNAIHVDPSKNQFQLRRPIRTVLHGLCTLGYVVRTIRCSDLIMTSSDNDDAMKQIEARFSKPVYMGDEVLIQVWKRPTNKNNVEIFFCVQNLTEGNMALEEGYAVLQSRQKFVPSKL